MRRNRLLTLLALLITAATGAWADWTGGTYTATATENLGAITVNGDATLTINSNVTVTINGGITIAAGQTLTVKGPGTLVVTGAKGNNGTGSTGDIVGGNGGTGGVAISGNIIVQGGAVVTATGGTGGTGGTGDRGGSGGNGGNAFAGTLTYKDGTVTANGGSGGSGGYGELDCEYASSGSAGKAFADANSVSFQTNDYILTSNGSAIQTIGGQQQITIAPPPVAVTGVTLPSTATVTLGDPVALTAAVAPANATDKKVKWTVTAGTDKVKLYKDAECKTEVGTDATDVLTVYVKGLAVGEATVKVESNEDETKTATCAVTAKHGTYKVSMKAGTTEASNWTGRAGGSGAFAAMPLKGVEGGTKPVELKYSGTDRVVKRVTATVTPKWKGDLTKILAADLESDGTTLTVENGTTLTGTLAENYRVVIADGATVTLDGVTISGVNDNNFQWAGITCLGDATIMLKDGTVNTVKGFHENYPGICVPTGKTLTIDGPGKLTASSNGKGAGIGGGKAIDCGNITIAATVGKVKGVKGADAPNSIGAGGQATCGTVTIGGTIYYDGSDYQNGGDTYLAAEKTVYPAVNTIVLNDLTADTELQDDDVVTGTLDGTTQKYKITIAAGAEVTLDGATINGVNDENCKWAGLTCLGDATIVLKDGTTNTVKGFHKNYPGIYVPENKTLTIKGTGSLTASSNGYGAGIGGGSVIACGNIVINSGTVTATGGNSAAGIGGGSSGSCGNITINGGNITATGGGYGAGIGSGFAASFGDIKINGGTVTATGGEDAAGIGGGRQNGSCGTITITSGVTSVTATKGAGAPYSIGAGKNGSCGTVTIGGTVYWQDNAAVNGGDTYLAQSTINLVNLKGVKASFTATNGMMLFGTLGGNYTISIADGATVTLAGVTINGIHRDIVAYNHAGLTCVGNATIILADGTANTVKGFNNAYPGISVLQGKTLTIKGGSEGTGSLTASPYDGGTNSSRGAGIGGEWTDNKCGNITIEGGIITATGGKQAAGIGGASGNSCGNILISGGTVTATGGEWGAGIGSSANSSCGTITITNGVTCVTARKGSATTPHSIGKGNGGSCGKVTIGGTVYWQNNAAKNGGGTYLAQAEIVYTPSVTFAANEYNEASWDGSKVVFTKKTAALTPTAVANSNTAVTWSDGWYTVAGEVTINGKVTLGADTYLILQDGAKLTINGQLDAKTNQKNLYIYGQRKGDGKLNVICSSMEAINVKSGKNVEIHGGEITAEGQFGGLLVGYIKVFSGKITATCDYNGGIIFTNSCDVYGGEIEATTNNFDFVSRGISDGGNGGTFTVYGGKVKGTGNGVQQDNHYGSGFGGKVKSGTAGIKFYFSDNGTDWDEGTYYGTATAAPLKRYAKAE